MDKPIFGIADSFDSGIFETFPDIVRPALYNALALALPIPSSTRTEFGNSSSFIPYLYAS